MNVSKKFKQFFLIQKPSKKIQKNMLEPKNTKKNQIKIRNQEATDKKFEKKFLGLKMP